MFGINDCHKARKNTKKAYTFSKRLKIRKTMKIRHASKNKFKNIILFSHKLDNLNKFIIDLQNISSSCSCEIDSSVNIIKYIKSYRNLIINLIKSI